MTDEEMNEAFNSLDVNGDGVIDYQEFRQWYFSGMKQFSGSKVSMIKAFSLL